MEYKYFGLIQNANIVNYFFSCVSNILLCHWWEKTRKMLFFHLATWIYYIKRKRTTIGVVYINIFTQTFFLISTFFFYHKQVWFIHIAYQQEVRGNVNTFQVHIFDNQVTCVRRRDSFIINFWYIWYLFTR